MRERFTRQGISEAAQSISNFAKDKKTHYAAIGSIGAGVLIAGAATTLETARELDPSIPKPSQAMVRDMDKAFEERDALIKSEFDSGGNVVVFVDVQRLTQAYNTEEQLAQYNTELDEINESIRTQALGGLMLMVGSLIPITYGAIRYSTETYSQRYSEQLLTQNN